jgi:hypothetical protein
MPRRAVSELSADLARAFNIQLVERYQAGIDASTSDAVATLITALEKTSGAVIQAGSVILVKFDNAVIVRQLTPREMFYWQEHPGLFKDPRRALTELEKAADLTDGLRGWTPGMDRDATTPLTVKRSVSF